MLLLERVTLQQEHANPPLGVSVDVPPQVVAEHPRDPAFRQPGLVGQRGDQLWRSQRVRCPDHSLRQQRCNRPAVVAAATFAQGGLQSHITPLS